MYRLAYRNFGDHEAVVVNHSVDAGSSVGVRWYELRQTPTSAFSLFQQGTFAPDSTYRWVGSAAMDSAGDIALCYSASSSTLFPSIRYTARVPSDSLGTMEAESVLQAGGGAQTAPRDGAITPRCASTRATIVLSGTPTNITRSRAALAGPPRSAPSS